jgi:hemolysin activation/secretion protein
MKSKASTAFLLLLSATAQGEDLQPLVPHGKEDFLEAEFLAKPVQPELVPIENVNDIVLVEAMKGLLLLGNLDEVLVNPDIEGIVFKDLEVPGDQIALVEKLKPYIVGEPLTQSKISELRRAITTFYQENDRPVVSVIVPEQDVTDGVLQIGVIEAKIGKITATGGKYFKPARMKDKFHLQEGGIINTDELLSDVAWANQNPFRQTNIIFQPGTASGTTDIEIITNDRSPVRVYIGGDNTGNHFTGRNRWYAGFNWGDVFGLDQTLSFQYTTSSDFTKFQAYTANYSIPLPWHNTLTFFGGYTRVHPDMPKNTTTHVGSHGWSGQASVRYIIPFGKTYGNFLQNFQAGYDYKVTNNTIEFSGNDVETKNARIDQFLASYYLGWTPNTHKVNADIDVYFSPGNWFGDRNKTAFNKLERGAKTSYVYTRIGLGDEFTFSKYNFGLYTLGRLQVSSSTLLPSEQYCLGGYDTVRGYEQRAVNYDNAFNFNFELRAPSFSLVHLFGGKYKTDTLTFLAFIDYGIGWAHDKKGVDSLHHLDPQSHNLLGIGPGFRYRIGPWFYARLDYGVPIINVNGKGHTPVLDFGLLASY